VLLCWQTWVSFGYRAGLAVTWQGNRSIPGGYPPPGVSRRPSYAVHRSYIVVICTSSSFGPSFVVVRRSYVRCTLFCLRMLSFVCHRLYVIVVWSFVRRRTLFIVLHTLLYVVRTLLFVCCCTLFVCHRMPFIFVRCRTSFVVLCTLSLWQCT
jgi:hypothetical protein